MAEASNSRNTKGARRRRRVLLARQPDLPHEGAAAPVSTRHGLRARLAYTFDNAIARRPEVVLLWLGLITLGVVLLATLVLTLLQIPGVNGDEGGESFLEAFWQTLLRILDSGTVASDVGWPARIVGIFVTLAGIFLAGSLIGLIANQLDQRIAELRKGHSMALETNHTLILGWSPRVTTIVSELVLANANQKGHAVVIVADEDKTQMEDTIRRAVPDTRTTRVVCRSAEPWTDEALVMGNAAQARCIVITEPDSEADTVKALLALHANHPGLGAPIVAEVSDPGLAGSLEQLLGGRVAAVCSDEVVAALTAQACRERGIGAVFAELLDFSGAEIYVADPGPMAGRSYAECVAALANGAVIGIEGVDGVPRLNPPGHNRLGLGERLIVVAQDDETWVWDARKGTPHADHGSVSLADPPARLAIIGWSSLATVVLDEMFSFLAPDAYVEVVADPREVNLDTVREELGTRQVTVTPVVGRPEAIAAHVREGAFEQAIVLGRRTGITPDAADARTLLTVLALRNQTGPGEAPARTVIELLDERHVSLAKATGADDFVVSDQLTSQMLAQLAETPELRAIFDTLFGCDGAMVRLREPLYVDDVGTILFADTCATALARGESALGVVNCATGTVRLAPPKDRPIEVGPDDRIIVLAS